MAASSNQGVPTPSQVSPEPAAAPQPMPQRRSVVEGTALTWIAVTVNGSEQRTTTVAALAKSISVPVSDLWLPCIAQSSTRAIVEVDDATPVGLRDEQTGAMCFDRASILETLGLFPPRPERFAVPENLLARAKGAHTLYVRMNEGGGRRRAEDGTQVLKRRITQRDAVHEGSCCVETVPREKKTSTCAKRSVQGPSAAPSGKSVAEGTMGPRAAIVQRDHLEQVIEEKLQALRQHSTINRKRIRAPADATNDGESTTAGAGEQSEQELRTSGDHLLHRIHESLLRVRVEPPLHQVKILSGNFKENISFRVGGSFHLNANQLWMRPDPCVLTYQHLPEANRNTGAAGRIFAPQRLILVLPLLHALMRPKTPDDDLLELDVELEDARLPETLRLFSKRGYKIVVVEHFPAVHHGNAYVLQSITGRIVSFLDKHFPLIPIQVMLSVASSYSAMVPGVSRFLLPNAGVFGVFLYHYNGQIEPDAERSWVVQTGQECAGGSGFASLTWAQQKGFAACCGRKGMPSMSLGALFEASGELLA